MTEGISINERELLEKAINIFTDENEEFCTYVKGLKAAEYVELIEEMYKKARLKKISRMSVEWGMWSRQMNLETRARIESGKDPEELKLKYVFVLWTTRSQLLELHYERPFFKLARKKKLAKECRQLKEMILTGKGLEDIEEFTQLAQRVIK